MHFLMQDLNAWACVCMLAVELYVGLALGFRL